MGLNTDIRNISNTLQRNAKKEAKNTKDLENKYNILDILKNEIEAAQSSGLDIFNALDRECIETGVLASLQPCEYFKNKNITRFFIHDNYYKIYLQVQKEKRLKEKTLQTITREKTQEIPKEAATVQTAQTVQKISVDYKKILQWLFIISTGIVLIPLYFCVAVTKNLK